MRKTFILACAAALLLPAASALAQDRPVTDEDRAAVAAYTQATARAAQAIKAARREVREQNAAFARALGRDAANFKAGDARAAYEALTQAQGRALAAELDGILLYKEYHPEWRPPTDGRKVAPPTGQAQGEPQGAKPKK